MQFISIKTRVLNPPQDDLFSVLDTYLTDVQLGDVIVVSSKVVAIDEGRCVPEEVYDAVAHLAAEAEVIIPRTNWKSPLTIVNHVMVGGAGVDRSNSNGFCTLLPKEPFLSAEKIHKYITERFGISEVGVIIADSRSQPCRYGAIGCGIGWWGIKPLVSHVGKPDLFGRKLQVERTNLIDGIVAGSNVVMGETNECTPVVIARGVPNLIFTDDNTRDQLFCPFEDDVMRVLYERFL